jgi:hypothetical protein
LSWKTQIVAYLQGQDSYGFISGAVIAPPKTIPNTDGDEDDASTDEEAPSKRLIPNILYGLNGIR